MAASSRFLSALALAAWACASQGTSTHGKTGTSYGHYAVTSPAYVGHKWDDAEGKRHDVQSPWSRQLSLLECTRACLATPKCSSFVVQARNEYCVLSRHGHCPGAVGATMVYGTDMQIFEVKRGRPGGNSSSCFDGSSCMSYGRPECMGEACDLCPYSCWNVTNPRPEIARKRVWPMGTPLMMEWTYCQGGWQAIWGSFYARGKRQSVMNTYVTLKEIDLELRVTLVYESGSQTVEAHFDSFSFKQRTITVGNYTGGKAGNSWGSPFINRKLSNIDDSNCFPFFYKDNERCSAGGVSQEGDRGYAWVTGDPRLDRTRIIDIILWIRQRDPNGTN